MRLVLDMNVDIVGRTDRTADDAGFDGIVDLVESDHAGAGNIDRDGPGAAATYPQSDTISLK
ncbi:hypothetical protein GCM10011348_16570 [Marinobacterium nitratireducens]|uniref:Uncharacterized protein n=1 Tax=Marinobacterium nitratireducens TaxID=518897 RepID=A0A917ZD30_9GAMM|nr:hypothetical protein GCM10011348_16570 [Marinobacterium nitratireducens]